MNNISFTVPALTALFGQAISELITRHADKPFNILDGVPSNEIDATRFMKGAVGSTMTYVPTTKVSGDWYIWDGTSYVRPENELIADYMVEAMADALKYSLKDVRDAVGLTVESSDEDTQKTLKYRYAALVTFANNLRSERGSNGLRAKIAKAYQVSPTFFDADRDYVVFADGQVLITSDPSAALVAPDSKRPVSRKMGFTLGTGTPEGLLRTFDEWELPKEEQKFIQMALGAALLGQGTAKNIIALVGISNTGKSLFISIMDAVFGGYSSSLPAGAIVDRGSTNFEQQKARGARFLYLEEPYEARTDDSFLKNLAGGGGVVSTQQKGKDVVEWVPQCMLFIGANHTPRINTQDDAIVRRMNIIGFNKTFKPSDPGFNSELASELLAEEGPKIARWIVDGAIAYKKWGKATLDIPKSVEQRAAGNVTEASVSLRWLQEKFDEGSFLNYKGESIKGSNMVPVGDLYSSFTNWAFNEGEKAGSIPSKKVWLDEINKFMGQPESEKGKRPGGYLRLWNVCDGTVQFQVKTAQFVSKLHNQ